MDKIREAVAKRLAYFDHPRKEWPDELTASVNYQAKMYRERYLETATVLIHMIREHDLGQE